jgi:hypothetical protein
MSHGDGSKGHAVLWGRFKDYDINSMLQSY